MDVEKLGEIVGASLAQGVALTAEQVESVLTDEEVLQAASRRGLTLGPLAVDPSVEAAEPVTAATVDTDTAEATWNDSDLLAGLHLEQQEKVTTLKSEWAGRFSTPERPLSVEDFGLVAVGEGEDRKVVLMLVTGNGLYRGSYNSIMADNETYLTEIDGQTIDSRKGMTYEAYKAFIARAKAQGLTLPDSAPLAKENGEQHTGTWLTGDPAGGSRARFGHVGDGGPYRRWGLRDVDWCALRVRPAAEV